MPERTTREVVHDLQLHRQQLVQDVHELENIVRYYLAIPERIADRVRELRHVRLSPRGYLVLAGAGLAVGLIGFLALRR
jgi:hypothetical protein